MLERVLLHAVLHKARPGVQASCLLVVAHHGKLDELNPLTCKITYRLDQLATDAGRLEVRIAIEPINRSETNFLNRLEEATDLLRRGGWSNVGVLADSYHMFIEEPDPISALTDSAPVLFHVQLCDDNRQAPGFGHTDFAPFIDALRRIGYQGFMGIEVLPEPDSYRAAEQAARFLQDA